MYADDLCIIAESAEELQAAINCLNNYCSENGLSINASKSKCMIFYRGRPPICSFYLDGHELELVNNFNYLGFHLTTQLSFSSHLQNTVSKANSRCGTLMSRLPLRDLPFELVSSVYDCYVLPLFRYGLPLWLSSISTTAKQSANSSYTKFLKSYLGVPFHANNAITHFLTNTCPLLSRLEALLPTSLGAFTFPSELSGYQLSILQHSPPSEPYNPIPLIPSFFWHSQIFHTLPTSAFHRKNLCRILYDFDHNTFCGKGYFHVDIEDCICTACGERINHYHRYFCEHFSH